MLKLWQLLILYFTLGVVEGEDPPADDPPADDPPADPPSDDHGPGDDLDSLLAADDPVDPPAEPRRENAAIRDARKRAQDADEARIRAEATLAAERNMRAQAAQPPSEEARKWAEEDALLKDPATDPQTKYWITANRDIRATRKMATDAVVAAGDIRDQTAFSQLLAKAPPKFAERYSAKVEEAVAGMRSRGEVVPPRASILQFFVGQDQTNAIFNGKPKQKTADAPAPKTVDRGRPPGARSDVSAKGRATEQEKRRARLENVQL